MIQYFKWIGIGLLVLVAVAFSVRNGQSVTLSYFFLGSMELPLYAVVFIFLCVGIILGMLLSFLARKHKIRGTTSSGNRPQPTLGQQAMMGDEIG